MVNMKRAWAPAVLVLLLAPSTAVGQDLGDKLQIHGFGEWAYGNTDGNRYLIGTNEGRYQNTSLGLNLSYRATDSLNIVGQFQIEQNPILDTSEIDVSLDYAFFEWSFSDALKMRAGRVKHPFGLYAEIFDVGTLRPFFLLPQGIYGTQGFTAQFYDGLGLTGSRGGDSWGVEYDLYLGQIQGDLRFPGPLSTNPAEVLEGIVDVGFTVTDVLGGRLTVVTPVEGLTFGLSAYQGDEVVESDSEDRRLSRETDLVHVQYLTDQWSLRGESGTLKNELFETESTYLEVARMIGERWQIAGRWDHLESSLLSVDLTGFPGFFRQILEHEDVAFGLNYWFAPNAVMKLDYHRVDGNRFAFPSDPTEIGLALFTDSLESETSMIVLGTQFSF